MPFCFPPLSPCCSTNQLVVSLLNYFALVVDWPVATAATSVLHQLVSSAHYCRSVGLLQQHLTYVSQGLLSSCVVAVQSCRTPKKRLRAAPNQCRRWKRRRKRRKGARWNSESPSVNGKGERMPWQWWGWLTWATRKTQLNRQSCPTASTYDYQSIRREQQITTATTTTIAITTSLSDLLKLNRSIVAGKF